MAPHEPTIASILRTLAMQYDGPVAERQVLDRVLEQRPSSAKNPYATIRERLRWDGLTLGWLRLDRHELMPLRVALQGLRFRCIPEVWEIDAGILPLVRLQPFAGMRAGSPLLVDTAGASYTCGSTPLLSQRSPFDLDLATPSFDVRLWYSRTGFAPGDSILVTVTATDPITLRIEHEPAAAFCPAAVYAQDTELADAIAERVQRSQLPLLPCDELLLPIFARAAWRTAYPGRPWQHLVARDARLFIIDEIFITRRHHDDALCAQGGEAAAIHQQARYANLADEIEQLQCDMGRSRQQDAEAGLWTGQIQCASAAHGSSHWGADHDLAGLDDGADSIYDYLGDVNDLDDAWCDSLWDETDAADDALRDSADGDDPSSELLAASQRLLAALPPEAAEQLQRARPEEAELIIASHLNDLLVREPSLFVKVDLTPARSRGEGAAPEPFGELFFDTIWDDSDDDLDDSWDDDWDDDLEEQAGMTAAVYMRSSELMSRFYEYLETTGKSSRTARARTRSIWSYGEFLAHYYGRALDQGDYATLDEYLFFFYPRQVHNASPRQVREIGTALKQFYRFLKLHGDIADDRFAEAIWRRRDQAARVIELYGRISGGSPGLEPLAMRLFAPYLP